MPGRSDSRQTGGALNDVLWNGSAFVAVGDNGVALSSADGVSWRQADTGTPETLYGVAWNGSHFTAVGTGGARVESEDGVAWTAVDTGTSNDLYSVRWSGGRLLALGQVRDDSARLLRRAARSRVFLGGPARAADAAHGRRIEGPRPSPTPALSRRESVPHPVPLRPGEGAGSLSLKMHRLCPRRTDIESILVIGSGPIVIGQACEFDYSGHAGRARAEARGLPGRPRQLEPGDDHDRPGARRRDLRRAADARVPGEDHREGAAGRAPADGRRPDGLEPRARARGRAGSWTSGASS